MRLEPNLARVALARFISRSGGLAAFFVGIWGKVAYQMEATAGEVAVVMASLSLSTLAGSFLAGVAVDRYSPRRVLIWGEIAFVPVALAVTMADTIPSMAVMAALVGFFGAPVFTAVTSFGPYLTSEPSALARVNGIIEGAGMAAFVAGPALGGLIVKFASIDWIFVMDAATSLVAAVIVLPVAVRQIAHTEERHALTEFKKGIAFGAASPSLRLLLFTSVAVWLMIGNFSALEPLFYRDVAKAQPDALGWVNAIFGGGMAVGSLALTRLSARWRNFRGVALLAAVNGPACLLYVGTPNLKIIALGGAVWGFFVGLWFPLHRTIVQSHTPDEMVGRVTGAFGAFGEGAQLIPLAVAPQLARVWGIQEILIGAGLALTAVILLRYPRFAALDAMALGPQPRSG